MTQTTYIGIRTGIKDYVAANISWVTAATCFDYSPTDAAVTFAKLPAVVVDFDPTRQVLWDANLEGYLKGIPMLLVIYDEIPSSDASHGRDISEAIAIKLKEVENLFQATPTIGGLVKGSTITNSKIELIQLTAVNIGVAARWAWVSLTVVALS